MIYMKVLFFLLFFFIPGNIKEVIKEKRKMDTILHLSIFINYIYFYT